MRLLFFTDAHLAERPPIARGPSYCDDVLAKLEEVKVLASDCDVSIFGGDLLHWPRPPETPHRLVGRLIRLFRDWPAPLYFVRGNHDAPDTGYERSALAVVLEALRGTHVQLLDEDVVETFGGVRVQLSAAHWSATIDEDPGAYQLARAPAVELAIKVAHGMLMPPGDGYPFRCVTMDQVDTEADVVLLGHMHWETPPMHLNGTLFAGPGSIARTARTTIESRRQVKVAAVTVESGQPVVRMVPLKSMRPAEEVFVWVEDRDVRQAGLFEGYVAALETGLDVGGVSVEEALLEMEGRAPVEVVALARRYLNEAGL